MHCPRCTVDMSLQSLDGTSGRPVEIDCCFPCQAFWFDGRESLALTPGATLTLFRVIGEHTAKPERSGLELAKCPRCRAHLRKIRDLQRATRFEYYSCPNGHGRLTTFFDFLKEKDFVRPLTPQQIAELRKNVQMVNCSNCGGPIDLAKTSACSHCGSPLSMLDMKQAETLVEQLRRADDPNKPIDPTLPLQLERARREVDAAFAGVADDRFWLTEVSGSDLFGATLGVLARFLNRGGR
jgi:Zn-finger nucleic acid-binding protein